MSTDAERWLRTLGAYAQPHPLRSAVHLVGALLGLAALLALAWTGGAAAPWLALALTPSRSPCWRDSSWCFTTARTAPSFAHAG